MKTKLCSPKKLTCVNDPIGGYFDQVKITNSQQSNTFARQFYHEDLEIYESMFLILLNRQNKTIAHAKISQGGVSGTVADVKIICKYAVDCLASNVILVHNHPSGNLSASNADDEITRKLKIALGYCDVALLDHIILTSEGYYSYADDGKI